MKMVFRWYGESDPVKLEYIRQIPGMQGVVSAIYDIPVGEVWDTQSIEAMVKEAQAKGLTLECIESVPVHEDIKLGLPSRDKYIENYCQTLANLAEYGIKVVCYNFMPVFDWMRSELYHQLPDGSTTLIYDNDVVDSLNPLTSDLSLPGWDSSYTKEGLKNLLNQYSQITEEKLWENLEYFIKKIIKICDQVGISMAIHPDDPPWSIFGLPRIITGRDSYVKLLSITDSIHNGITLCTGSLGANPANDIPALIREFGERIHFMHLRNVLITGEKCFEESAHLSSCGSLDMYEIVKAAYEIGFEGYFRPDHGRMIWDETGKPGYGLFDRALGAVYLNGLYEAIRKDDKINENSVSNRSEEQGCGCHGRRRYSVRSVCQGDSCMRG